jgi:hydroxymethylbilane synthase
MLQVQVRKIKTQGDLVTGRALSKVGGTGLFVKEIEDALLAGEIDVAVHSLKDMPIEQPEGVALGAILERGDPRDVLVVREGLGNLVALPIGARIGTSSLRRRAQLLALRPDLDIADVRGNVDTRLRKLWAGEYDGMLLAAAGLFRLGRADEIKEYLPVEAVLPAAGQGALCVEMRADDLPVRALIHKLDHLPTHQAVDAERALLRHLEGGCQIPVGAYATVRQNRLHLRGLIASLDGSHLVRDEVMGLAADARRLGAELAERLLARGGSAILEEIRHAA